MIRVLFLLLTAAPWAHAVSRIGGGAQSLSSQAQFLIDENFKFSYESGLDGFTVQSLPGAGGLPRQEEILIDEFALQYPEAKDLDAQGTRELFESTYDFTAIYHSDPCVVGFYKRSATAHTYVVTWGAGRGFVFVGTDSEESRRAILHMIRTLTLMPGACAWK